MECYQILVKCIVITDVNRELYITLGMSAFALPRGTPFLGGKMDTKIDEG